MKILFDGDSITDCYKTQNIIPNGLYAKGANLGVGYPMLVSNFLKINTMTEYIIENHGVAGESIDDLLDRINKACEFNPDYYVLMIGINDLWRVVGSNKTVLNEDFENNYRKILDRIKKNNNDVKFIIQTITYTQSENSNDFFIKEVVEKNNIIKKLAKEYNVMLIDSNKIILEKIKETKHSDWLFDDGIHYTSHTNMLIANEIIKLINNKK